MTNFYVCINHGNDNNDGSIDLPFQHIQRAVEKAYPGDTINVKPGIYRERITPVRSGIKNKPITFTSVVKHEAIIRGSCKWQGTIDSSDNTIMYGPINNDIFTDDSHFDGKNPFLIPCCVTPWGREGKPETKIKSIKNSDKNMVYSLGQVFVDDEMYLQCPYKSEMYETHNSWFYDTSCNILYINGAKSSQNIEITNQRRLFAPHKRNLKNIVVDGFTFERCGNQYPNKFWARRSNQQAGAVGTRCGKFWKITNNIIQYANGIGIDWGNEGGLKQDIENGKNGFAQGSYGNIISHNIIRDNGAAGTAAFMANKFEFTKNTVERNNNLHFSGKQRWESAGIKIHKPKNSNITSNIVRNNYCHGIWSDQGAGKNSLFANNIILNNKKSGIEFEIGTNTNGRVINNIFDKNDYGVRFATSGGVLISHNIFIYSKTCDIGTVFFKRDDKWDSLNLEVYYNIFVDSPQYYLLTPNSEEPKSSRFFGNNIYKMDDNSHFQVKYNWKNKPFLSYKKWDNLFNDKSKVLECSATLNDDYNLEFSCFNIPTFQINDKMGLPYDYFSNEWKQLCNAGPFSKLNNGYNIICL